MAKHPMEDVLISLLAGEDKKKIWSINTVDAFWCMNNLSSFQRETAQT